MRVLLTTLLGYLFSLPLPRALGIEPKWGVAGLTASAGIAGWVEFILLRQTLNRRIGRTGLPSSYVTKLWAGAGMGAAVGWGLKLLLGHRHPVNHGHRGAGRLRTYLLRTYRTYSGSLNQSA